MAAECFHCTVSLQAAFSDFGSEPLGVCRRCHVMCCGRHALRDPRVPEWVCCLCDINLLVTSAAIADRDRPAPILSRQLGRSFLLRQILFGSLAAYLAARPGFPDLHQTFEYDAASVKEAISSIPFNREGTALWNELTPDGQLLLAAAIQLAILLEVSNRDLPEPLQRLHSLIIEQGLSHG